MDTVWCYDDCNAGYNLVFRTAEQVIAEMKQQYGELPAGVTSYWKRDGNRIECYLSAAGEKKDELVAFAFLAEVVEPQ